MMKLSMALRRHGRRSPAIAVAYSALVGLAGPTRAVPEFMTYDATERLVRLTVIARYNDTNSGYNLNGSIRGGHRVTVPLGWRVQVTFTNRDVVPHSLGLVRESRLVPIRIEKPALSGAATHRLVTGMPPHDHDDFAFVAALPGSYLLACGVPGHAVNGGYLQFVIWAGTAVPTYEGGAAIAMSAGRE